mmetsp:Transcript_56616/g.166220  ORF Transcript_56616/g.166220 Transcript_56616/m.166220 type:complete len:106 (-) Transcript_56616:1106-1423(-)
MPPELPSGVAQGGTERQRRIDAEPGVPAEMGGSTQAGAEGTATSSRSIGFTPRRVARSRRRSEPPGFEVGRAEALGADGEAFASALCLSGPGLAPPAGTEADNGM